MKSSTALRFLLASTLLVLHACGGGGTAATPLSAPASAGFTVEDAAVDTLSTVTLTLSSLKLVAPGGGATGNLLAAPRGFEFLGLSTKQALLTLSPDIPAGTYDQVELVVSSAVVRDLAGALVTVTLRTTTARATLTDFGGAALAFDGSGFVPCRIDVDLSRSLIDDPGSAGDLLFDLLFTASVELAPAFDEFRGRVASVSPGSSSFLARILDDSAPGQTFGLLQVLVSDGDFLLHDDGRTFASAAEFLGELDAGDSVQVSGAMGAAGVFNASRVISGENEAGDDHGGNRIEIEGEVQSLDTVAGTFELFIKEIEKGAAVANPVLAALGNPATITISYDANTRILADDAGSSGVNLVDTTLIPGMEVDVRFATFVAPPPFLATSIEVGDGGVGEGENGIEYEGNVTATGGLPLAFELTLELSEAAVLAGLVTGPVTVSLTSAPIIFLDSGPDPALLASQIVGGLKCEVNGDLSGPPAAATLMAFRVKVSPGELEGTLVAVDLGASTVTVDVTKVKRSFGGATPPAGTVVLAVDPTAFLRGDETPMALVDLAAMLAGLGVGQSLSVEIEGIADGSGGFVTWDIRAKTES